MKIYSSGFSPNALRVRHTAYELGLDFELIEVDMRAGETKTPEYLALNPNGKVPVLDHDGYVLWESRAIMAYLSSLKPERNLCPADPKSRGIADKWCYWQAIHIGPAMQKISMERLFKAKFGMGEPDEAAIEQQLKDVAQFMPVLDAALAGKDFVTGSLSIADISIISTFTTHEQAGISLVDLPNVSAWVARMQAMPSWQKAVEPLKAMMGG